MLYGHVPGIDKPVSRLVQGTLWLSATELDKTFATLDDFYALGCNTFDTAHVYGKGDNERTVGRWVNERGLRDKLVIIGKGAHPVEGRKRVTPADITSDLLESLERFQFDVIDLYLLHRDDPSVPVGPIVETLNEHLSAGRIHAFGGSNWRYERIQEANDYAQAHGLTPFVVSSPNFSLAEQVKEPWPGCVSISGPNEAASRRWYAEAQMALFTWSSLAGGFFSGRFTRDNLHTFDNYFDKICVQAYCYETNFRRLERARQLAQARGLSLPQLALAYVMSQPMNIFAIIGSQNGAELQANIEASTVKLTPEEMAWLELERDTMENESQSLSSV